MVIFLGLAACGRKTSNSANPAPAPGQDNSSRDYVQSANLNTFQTSEELVKSKGNVVHLTGTGKSSAYRAIYKFNSGGNGSFRVLETLLESQWTNCAAPTLKMVLTGKNSSQEINVINKYALDFNTDYSLEVSVKHSCSKLDLSIDLLAWAGKTDDQPEIAKVCQGQKTYQATFLMTYTGVSATSTTRGQEKFLFPDTYCGQAFNGTTTTCTGPVYSWLYPKTSTLSHGQCTAKNGAESRSYSVDFDSVGDSATVQCWSDQKPTFKEKFAGCRTFIVDYKP
jgi:hypothetical protein